MYYIHGTMSVGHLKFKCSLGNPINNIGFRSTGRKDDIMEFLVTTTNAVTFENKELQKATNAVLKLGDAIKKNWFAIAHIVAHVDATECFKDDGFNTVHEWVEKTFGIKKTASYSLLTIGKEYTREIVNASGKVVGYGTNLITEGSDDFSKTQVEKMLPAGHELAVELVNGGEITPEMSAKEISRVVKSRMNPEPETSETEPKQEPEPETSETEPEQETETVSVWDEDGNEYKIPVDILKKYLV